MSILIFISVFLLSSLSLADEHRLDRHTNDLAKKNLLGIPREECVNMENKIGQLLLIFVDGNGSNPPSPIHPLYIDAVRELKIGGIRLNSDGSHDEVLSNNPANAHLAIRRLHSETRNILPPYISIDNYGAKVPETQPTYKSYLFGLGTFNGFIGSSGSMSNSCFDRAAYLQAFLHKAMGINLALGPTVDPSSGYKKNKWFGYLADAKPEDIAYRANSLIRQLGQLGIGTTVKHFPYTPENMDLHTQNENVTQSTEEVMKILQVYKIIQQGKSPPDFMMSTHLLNNNIDDVIATISKKWVKLLREDIGYHGILISDGLTMVNALNKDLRRQMLAHWKTEQAAGVSEDYSVFAALSILAGHDMVIVDDSLRRTKKVFSDLHKISCQNNSLGASLRARIEESYTKIKMQKEKNRKNLTSMQDKAPTDLMVAVASVLNEKRWNGTEWESRICWDNNEYARIQQLISNYISPKILDNDYKEFPLDSNTDAR